MPTKVVARAGVALGLSIAAPIAFAAGPAGAAVDGRELSLKFESTVMRANAGQSALSVTQVSHRGGSVNEAAGANGNGTGIRLPAFKASDPPLAVLTVLDTQGVDDLEPGASKFRFGADFTLDAKSAGSPSDNGNNLVQRGLFGSSMQYKIDVDKERPGCRVKGDQGAVTVRATRAVAPDTWYRMHCIRDGGAVRLTVKRLSDGLTWSYSANGNIGSLHAARKLPLSIGGKVNASGDLMTGDSDQFNGRVDNVYLNIR